MCGIVGIMTANTANDKQLKALSHLLLLDQLRGEHATGLAKINTKTGEASIHKGAVNAIDYLASEDTKNFLQRNRQNIYIGHNRFATMGSRRDDGAHPFQHKHITMVHNGTVDRWSLKDLEGFPDPNCTVDSEMVCRTIAEKGIEEAVKLFSGAFSLVWWDSQSRTLNFLRNEKRPMWISHTDSTTMWASEKNFLQVLLAREDKYLEEYEPYQTKPHTLYSWHYDQNGGLLHKGHAKVKPLKIEGIEDPFVYSRDSWKGSSTGYYGSQGGEDQRTNKRLKSVGLELKAGDRIKVAIQSISRVAKFDSVVHIFGFIEGPDKNLVKYRTFNVSLKKLIPELGTLELQGLPTGTSPISDWVQFSPGVGEVYGTVSACYSVSEKNPDTQVFETFDRVVLDDVCNSSMEEVPSKKQDAGSGKDDEAGAKFPFKVDGWTFNSPQEFLNLTSQGCSCCGEIPNVFNKYNPMMMVYSGVGNLRATILDAEFVCGKCIHEDVSAAAKAV